MGFFKKIKNIYKLSRDPYKGFVYDPKRSKTKKGFYKGFVYAGRKRSKV